MGIEEINEIMKLRNKGLLSDKVATEAIQKAVGNEIGVKQNNIEAEDVILSRGRKTTDTTTKILKVLNSVDSITTPALALRIGHHPTGGFYRTVDYVARRHNLLHKIEKRRKHRTEKSHHNKKNEAIQKRIKEIEKVYGWKKKEEKKPVKRSYAKAAKRMAFIGKKMNQLMKEKNFPRRQAMKAACVLWKMKNE